MEKLFLSHLKSRIAWKSWYKALAATFAAAVLAFGSFSFWSLVFGIALYCVAFFWHRKEHGEVLTVSFLAFVAFLSIGGYVIGNQTDFFEYIGGLQIIVAAIAYLVFLGIFSAVPAGTRVSVSEAGVHTALLLFWTMLSGMLVDRWGSLWFVVFFAVVALIAHEVILRSHGERGVKSRGYALVAGLIAAELLSVLRFLPFHLIPQAIIVTVALVIFFDALRAHLEGRIGRAFLIEKAVTFAFFAVLLGFFSKWTL